MFIIFFILLMSAGIAILAYDRHARSAAEKAWDISRRCNRSFADYCRAEKRFEAWAQARPFQHVSQSDYARGLVFAMIDAYWYLLENDQHGVYDRQRLDWLYELLSDSPPSDDPPATRRSTGGLFNCVDTLFVL